MLKRTWSLLTLLTLVLLPSAALAQETPTSGAAKAGTPKLVVPDKIKDFGTVPQGEHLKATFELHNEGTAPLQVRSVRPTCGCTIARFDKDVAPGGQGVVEATVDTTNFSGPIAKALLVLTNDPEVPTMSLVVKAMVQPYVEVLPRPLVRFNTVQGDDASEKVTLVSAMGRSFKVTGVESSDPSIKATVRQLSGDELLPGKKEPQYEVALNMAPDAKVGPVNATIVVHTDDPKAPKVPIRAFGVVRALVHVTPADLQFGTVEAAMKPGRNVIVLNNQPTPLKITGVSVDNDAFAATVTPMQEGQRYQITVTINPEAATGTQTGTLTITTTDTRYPVLKVPVAANIK